jgi:hypothetical protein
MGNILLTRSEITRRALWVLENNLAMAKQVNRQYSDEFKNKEAKIGMTINIRKPPRYLGRSGATLQLENSVEQFTSLTLTNREGCDIVFDSVDLALNIDDFSDRFIKPAVATVSNKIDRNLCGLYKTVANFTGVPGTPLAGITQFLYGNARMADEACPQDGDRAAIVDPWTNATMVNGMTNFLQPASKISDQYISGNMGVAAGCRFSLDQNTFRHTVGPQGGTPLFNGVVGYTANTIASRGWTASANLRLYNGDIFTVAGVYAVNPQTRASSGYLRCFVVSADSYSDGSGNLVIPIGGDGIVTSGQFQNVSAAPVDGAAITVFPTTLNGSASTPGGTVTPACMIFHPNAFALATVDLPIPQGVHYAERIVSKKLGISLRAVQAYDIVNDIFPFRLDVLYGFTTLYAGLANRVHG